MNCNKLKISIRQYDVDKITIDDISITYIWCKLTIHADKNKSTHNIRITYNKNLNGFKNTICDEIENLSATNELNELMQRAILQIKTGKPFGVDTFMIWRK